MSSNYDEIVDNLMMHCLYKPEEIDGWPDNHEIPEDALMVEGILTGFAFHPERIEEKKGEIEDLIDHIVIDDFYLKESEDGMSFLALNRDKDGNQWTDTHRTMESFMCLCMAIGRCIYALPRPLWGVYAQVGGMPYLLFGEPEELQAYEEDMPDPTDKSFVMFDPETEH